MHLLASLTTIAFALSFLPALPLEDSTAAMAPCTGPNDHLNDDLADTMEDPTHPECGSLTDPCWGDGGRCGGCGPPIVEWIIGPIYCP